MMAKKTLRDLKPGDAVALLDGGDVQKRIVLRASATSISLGARRSPSEYSGQRFGVTSGREVGGSMWHAKHIEVWDDAEHGARMKRARTDAWRRAALARMQSADVGRLTDEQLACVVDLLAKMLNAAPLPRPGE